MKNVEYICIFAAIGIMGCGTTYLDNVHSITNIQNCSPIPVIERKKKDARLDLQLQWSKDNNDIFIGEGNPDDYPIGYPVINVKLRHTVAIGKLGIDYSISDIWFLYGKLGSGILDNHNYFTSNIGVGAHINSKYICTQWYFSTGMNQFYSDAVIEKYQWGSDQEFIETPQGKALGLVIGLGSQFITNFHYRYWPNIYAGIDVQAIQFCQTTAYALHVINPTIGAIENIKNNNQLIISIGYPKIFPQHGNDKAFMWPTFLLEWIVRLPLKK
ncbi:MAG: hypothetical protein ABSF80_06430 [Chitinispirillaceae bacterium]|jgi:hypothetical protein